MYEWFYADRACWISGNPFHIWRTQTAWRQCGKASSGGWLTCTWFWKSCRTDRTCRAAYLSNCCVRETASWRLHAAVLLLHWLAAELFYGFWPIAFCPLLLYWCILWFVYSLQGWLNLIRCLADFDLASYQSCTSLGQQWIIQLGFVSGQDIFHVIVSQVPW